MERGNIQTRELSQEARAVLGKIAQEGSEHFNMVLSVILEA